jgi:hypothetical protein
MLLAFGTGPSRSFETGGPLNHGLQFLGFVEASDAKAAEVAAAKDFGLTNFQCKRLLVQEAGRDH